MWQLTIQDGDDTLDPRLRGLAQAKGTSLKRTRRWTPVHSLRLAARHIGGVGSTATNGTSLTSALTRPHS